MVVLSGTSAGTAARPPASPVQVELAPLGVQVAHAPMARASMHIPTCIPKLPGRYHYRYFVRSALMAGLPLLTFSSRSCVYMGRASIQLYGLGCLSQLALDPKTQSENEAAIVAAGGIFDILRATGDAVTFAKRERAASWLQDIAQSRP